MTSNALNSSGIIMLSKHVPKHYLYTHKYNARTLTYEIPQLQQSENINNCV